MKRFENWLKSRDAELMEVISGEEMEKHGMDAMQYAREKVKKQQEEEMKAKSIKDLHVINNRLESWVSHDDYGTEKLKLIGAVLHLQSPDVDWVGDADMGAQLIHSAVEQLHELEGVENLSALFSHQNLLKHMSDPNTLHDLAELLKTDYKREILPLIRKRYSSAPHGNGEMGKHFAEFATSHMLALTQEMIKKLESEKEPKVVHMPVHVESKPQQTMQSAQPTSVSEPMGAAL